MAEWLRRILPGWLVTPEVTAAVALLSLALLIGSILALPWLVARLPRDYFVRRHHSALSLVRRQKWRRPAHVAKNVLGLSLLVAGVVMLVLPGQGLLTILMSLVLLEFPGKRALERKLVERPRVLRALNALRRRAGSEPLVLD